MKRNVFGRLMIIGAATAGMSGAFAGENATPPARHPDTRSVLVGFADLDLSRDTGARTLYQRLRTAARRVCGEKDLHYIEDVRDWKRCATSALNDAVGKIDNARLTALHEEGGDYPKQPLVPIAGLP